jgi:transposase InsO family protein
VGGRLHPRVKPKGRLYIWTSQGWLYVAAVIDLFSRRYQ